MRSDDVSISPHQLEDTMYQMTVTDHRPGRNEETLPARTFLTAEGAKLAARDGAGLSLFKWRLGACKGTWVAADNGCIWSITPEEVAPAQQAG